MDRLYIVVRKDLPAGLQLAQACHAARKFPDPVTDDENLIVLHVDNELSLWKLVASVLYAGFKVEPFEEPDLDNALTAASFDGRCRELLAGLPLAFK